MKKKIAILGGGETGIGAAVLAKKQGLEPFVSDNGTMKQKYKTVLSKYGIEWEERKHSGELIGDSVEVIKSPGIPDDAEIVAFLNKRRIPVISEIEFAGRYTTAKKICVTGSNGKTTTSSWIYHMLCKAGMNAALAGNVGKSFALQVAEGSFDYYVIELSSFQLDGMFDFRADIGILMNISADHLDRYGYDIQRYIDSKFRITQNQTPDDYVIYCLSDFQGVEHRLEHVLVVHGIRFINDSKATNVNSTWYAMESMPENVIWIVGGIDKGNDYSVLEELVKKKVKAIICLGKDNSKIYRAFAESTESILETTSMTDAVRTAYYLGKKGDTVLLSPACASFDLFENYEDRGRQFKDAVRYL